MTKPHQDICTSIQDQKWPIPQSMFPCRVVESCIFFPRFALLLTAYCRRRQVIPRPDCRTCLFPHFAKSRCAPDRLSCAFCNLTLAIHPVLDLAGKYTTNGISAQPIPTLMPQIQLYRSNMSASKHEILHWTPRYLLHGGVHFHQ